VVESRRKIDSAEEAYNLALFPAPKKFSESLVYRVLLGPKAANFLGLVEQTIVNLEVCGHRHTLFHTLSVSIMNLSDARCAARCLS
jgi:hypothetical protein